MVRGSVRTTLVGLAFAKVHKTTQYVDILPVINVVNNNFARRKTFFVKCPDSISRTCAMFEMKC